MKKVLGILTLLVAVFWMATFFVPNIVEQRTVYIINEKAGTLGTGVIINDHEILTNHHVIANGDTFRILFSNLKEFKGKVVYDAEGKPDLAVLKTEEEFPWWRQGTISCSSPQRLGSTYFTVGQTFGLAWVYSELKYGIRQFDMGPAKTFGDHYFGMMSNINHGNSGGGVFDWFGNQFGIVTAIWQIDGFAIKDGKIGPTGMAANIGPTWIVSSRDICPILKNNDIEFHQGYGIDDLLDFINRIYDKAYYEVEQLND